MPDAGQCKPFAPPACLFHRHALRNSSMPVRLDLRNLPPPEPMDRILDAVEALRPG
ncbi:MAG: DUF2249 domain-containing protein, partial [Gammaproteobacteria bacterium]|nr:DUF2249 domain-containing protein [Gammaproteobacteria bacterium]